MARFRSESAAGFSLIVGGVAFGLFWGRELINVQPPWLISLGVHGLSIVLISFALINLQRRRTHSGVERNLGWSGVALTLAGLVTPGSTLRGVFALAIALIVTGLMTIGLRATVRDGDAA